MRLDHITQTIDDNCEYLTDMRSTRKPLSRFTQFADRQARLPGDHRDVEPPDPLPNSEVKRVIADGSVGPPHARVGHRQALIPKGSPETVSLFFGAPSMGALLRVQVPP